MDIIIALALSTLFALSCKHAIKSHPFVFYLLAALAVAAFAGLSFSGDVPALARIVYPYIQRCLLAFGLFAIVMFIGVLPETSKIRKYLAPIRGELSIIASILTIGHVIAYFASYVRQFFVGFVGLSTAMLVSFAVSFVLVLLLAILAVTSVQTIRRNMDADLWKRIQTLAYPFFGLIFVHLALILGASASGPEQKAFMSIIVYTVVFGSYCALRIRKAVLDNKRKHVEPLNVATRTQHL